VTLPQPSNLSSRRVFPPLVEMELGTTTWLQAVTEDLKHVREERRGYKTYLTASTAGFSSILTSLFAFLALQGATSEVVRTVGYYLVGASFVYMGVVALGGIYSREAVGLGRRAARSKKLFDPQQLTHSIQWLAASGAAILLALDSISGDLFWAAFYGFIGAMFAYSGVKVLFPDLLERMSASAKKRTKRMEVSDRYLKNPKETMTTGFLVIAVFAFALGTLAIMNVWDSVGRVEYLGASILVIALFSSARVCLANYRGLIRTEALESELESLRQGIIHGELGEWALRARYSALYSGLGKESSATTEVETAASIISGITR